jgi:hypothetical protein
MILVPLGDVLAVAAWLSILGAILWAWYFNPKR